jgi:hypothetical protein
VDAHRLCAEPVGGLGDVGERVAGDEVAGVVLPERELTVDAGAERAVGGGGGGQREQRGDDREGEDEARQRESFRDGAGDAER